MNFPRTVDEITPEWLTQVLRDGGAIKLARVESISATRMGEDSGVTSAINRLELTYDTPEHGAPTVLISKQAVTEEAIRLGMPHVRFYETEANFYRDWAPKLEIKTPKIFFSEFDPDTKHVLILQQDLNGMKAFSGSEDCDIEYALSAIHDLSIVHAAWWRHPDLDKHSWYNVFTGDGSPENMSNLLVERLEKVLSFAGEFVPEGVEELTRKLAPNMHEMGAAITQQPKTLIHGDFRTANMFFDHSESGRPRAVGFDWQNVQAARGGMDVAHFLSSSFTVNTRQAVEHRLMDEYHTTLIDHGVKDFSKQELERDIQHAVLTRVFARFGGLSFGGQKMLETEQGKNNLIGMLGRLQMLIDWNCDEVIPK